MDSLKKESISYVWFILHFVFSIAIVYKISGTQLGRLGSIPTFVIVFLILGGISLVMRKLIPWWSHPFDAVFDIVIYFFFEVLFGALFLVFLK